jgi:Na+/H+ antiporter NhaD/arsenite permease-like protein
LSTESLRTYNKIEPSSYSIKDRVIQIIGFSTLLLWIIVYEIKKINFIEYEDGLFIKAFLFLAAFFFMVSVLLGAWTYYKIKRAYSNDPSTGVANPVKWFIIGLFVLMISIPHIFFPESERFSGIYLIALTYAGKHVLGKISKNP